MQTPKPSHSGGPQKSSPRPISSEASPKSSSPQTASSEAPQKVSPRVVRQLNTGPRFLDPTASSSNQANRAPKERSPKVVDRKSPRSPLSEKKRPSKIPELESQISQLEHDLEVVKDQLISTEAQKKQAQKDAEESNHQLLALTLKLEELQKHLLEQPSSEEQKLGSQSELEAIKKQSSHDSAALASALDEITQLKIQLETVAESEAPQAKHSESEQNDLLKLKEKLSDTLLIVEEMKQQVMYSKESEAQAQALVGETLVQLETAKKMVETLRLDGLKATEAYKAIASELEQSRARVNFLEDLVSKLQADISSGGNKDSQGKGEGEMEVGSLKLEVEQLRSALEAHEIRYNEERSRSVEKIQDAMEMVEKFKSASSQRESELEKEVRRSKYEIEELKANLMDKETELQGICEENEGLTMKLESSVSGQREIELEKKFHESKSELETLKASLAQKEVEWQCTIKENEKLKQMMNGRTSEEVGDLESDRAAESEAAMKVSYMVEEIEKSNKKAARVGEQLEVAQAANAEMEAELRRVKVQSDQWRKAAEAAAAMLSAGNNGQIMERTGSMDSHYSPQTGKISSPYADDLDEELKKKNANMLRRFGVLWKKPQK
ncbi:interactor of constitutive active ROPs 3-like isoform X2 [Salvia hispanica]|uniref:interactor of constitutive active ROPs 3-like isoform X2 n=1 Tax=Salvia hispanica TaxID=49212 RepID=UPI002009C40C|nr:interactor of constitutive active ROPs 3-like isoform X2 [Salvia hispanica]